MAAQYGHKERAAAVPALSEQTCVPPRLWRDHPDARTRTFFCGDSLARLNERSLRFAEAEAEARRAGQVWTAEEALSKEHELEESARAAAAAEG